MVNKKIFLVFIMAILLVGVVDARIEKDFDDRRGGTYGEITIKDRYFLDIFGWFEKKIAVSTITEHTDECLFNCYTKGTTELFETGKLFEDIKFKNTWNYTQNIPYEVFYLKNVTYNYNIPTYNSTTNRSIRNSASTTREEWVRYHFTDLRAGNYSWWIRATKQPQQRIDVIPRLRGIDYNEWAWYDTLPGDFAVFTADGTWNVPAGVTNASCLVIAGGAGGGSGGGNDGSGGGGAGGLIFNSSCVVPSGGTVTVVVGDGGAGGVGTSHGTNGSASWIVTGAVTQNATGGGGGSASTTIAGYHGGSAGGGYGDGTASAGGTGVAGQGNDGGDGDGGSGGSRAGGGGGGAGAVGQDAGNGGVAGDGGTGLTFFGELFACGGGGGGTTFGAAGCPGAGAGGNSSAPLAANASHGNGGGGAGIGAQDGAAGGSGLVFFRFIAPASAPVINLISPTTASFDAYQNTTIIFIASDATSLVNVTMTINGSIVAFNDSGINGTQYNFTLNLIDGNYTIHGTATNGGADQTNSSQITLSINTTPLMEYIGPTPANDTVIFGDQLNVTTNVTYPVTTQSSVNITINFRNGTFVDSFFYDNTTLGGKNFTLSTGNYTFSATATSITSRLKILDTRFVTIINSNIVTRGDTPLEGAEQGFLLVPFTLNGSTNLPLVNVTLFTNESGPWVATSARNLSYTGRYNGFQVTEDTIDPFKFTFINDTDNNVKDLQASYNQGISGSVSIINNGGGLVNASRTTLTTFATNLSYSDLPELNTLETFNFSTALMNVIATGGTDGEFGYMAIWILGTKVREFNASGAFETISFTNNEYEVVRNPSNGTNAYDLFFNGAFNGTLSATNNEIVLEGKSVFTDGQARFSTGFRITDDEQAYVESVPIFNFTDGINNTFSGENNYLWGTQVCDVKNFCQFSSINKTFLLDLIPVPVFIAPSPDNDSVVTTTFLPIGYNETNGAFSNATVNVYNRTWSLIASFFSTTVPDSVNFSILNDNYLINLTIFGSPNQTIGPLFATLFGPQVVLDAPLNNTFLADPMVLFNATIETPNIIKNASLYNNQSGSWILNETITYLGIVNTSSVADDSTASTVFIIIKTINLSQANVIAAQAEYDGTPAASDSDFFVSFNYVNGSQVNTTPFNLIHPSTNITNETNPWENLTFVSSINYWGRHNGGGGTSVVRDAFIWRYNNKEVANFTKNISQTIIWNVEMCDNIACIFAANNFSLTSDNDAPIINITVPFGTIAEFIEGENQTLTWGITDNGLTVNTTIASCSFTYNGTQVNLTKNQCINLNTTSFLYVFGADEITMNVTDLSGNVGGQIRSWNYTLIERATIFQNPITFSAIGTYLLNFNSTGINVSTPYFNYSGVITIPQLNNNGFGDYTINTTRTAMVADAGANNFTFIVNIDGSNHTFSTQTQTVIELTLMNCTAGNESSYLHITFADEINLSVLTATMNSAIFSFWLDDPDDAVTETFSNAVQNLSYDFCVFPSNQPVFFDIEFPYSAVGYPQRVFTTDDVLLTNVTTNQTLYLLDSATGFFTRYVAINSLTGEALSGVSVTVKKTIGGVPNTTVAQGFTDDTGLITLWLNPDDSQDFTFVLLGFSVTTFTIRPSSPDTYQINMVPSTATDVGNGTDVVVDLEFVTGPDNTSLTEDITYNFTFEYNKTNIISANVIIRDEDLNIVSNQTLTTITGVIFTNVNVAGNDSFTAIYTITTTNETLELYETWTILNSTAGNYSLAEWLKFGEDLQQDSRWWPIFKIILLLGILISAGTVFHHVDAFDSSASSLAASVIIVWIFSMFGLLDIGIPGVSAAISESAVASLYTVVTLSFIVWRFNSQ